LRTAPDGVRDLYEIAARPGLHDPPDVADCKQVHFLLIAVSCVALAWLAFRVRKWRALMARVQQPRQEVVDNPAEPRASTRFRAVVRTQERPKWEAWGAAVAAADVAAHNPTWAPTGRVLNPDCTVVVEEIATGRVLQSYPWGHDLDGAERHATSLNERAAAEGVTKFFSDLV
jgi:hypothetical protein